MFALPTAAQFHTHYFTCNSCDKMKTLSFAIFIFGYLSRHSQAQSGPGLCHPYPGAVAKDCLELIGSKLGDETQLDLTSGPATITSNACSIVTKQTSGPASVDVDTVVRMALTTIGQCALSDLGSISGSYTDPDLGIQVCYLYPGR